MSVQWMTEAIAVRICQRVLIRKEAGATQMAISEQIKSDFIEAIMSKNDFMDLIWTTRKVMSRYGLHEYAPIVDALERAEDERVERLRQNMDAIE